MDLEQVLRYSREEVKTNEDQVDRVRAQRDDDARVRGGSPGRESEGLHEVDQRLEREGSALAADTPLSGLRPEASDGS